MTATKEEVKKAVTALHQICDTIIETVTLASSGPLGGMPAGELYAVLMAFGCTLSQFEMIVGGLVAAGKIRREGHLLKGAA